MKRYLEPFIINDLVKKMVFMGGPRQVGKTTLAEAILEKFQPSLRLNWDRSFDRKAILAEEWPQEDRLIVFDELHKYPEWKQWIKGIYDTRTKSQQYFVTGSARLDIYKQGGDSLLGRYHYWRLHPLTLDEYPDALTKEEVYKRLLTFGGFPEPFLLADEREARRWRRERFDRILKEDVRDLEPIRHIQLLMLFVEALRDRVGAGISLASIARDLEISPNTAIHWLGLFQRMYIGFAVYPYTKNVARSLQKQPKIYFFDNADVNNGDGARLENLVATTLLKRLHFIEDYEGRRCSLHYVRDKEGREVDFVTVIDGEVQSLIEVKLDDATISPSLKYHADRIKAKEVVQLVGKLKRPFDKAGVKVISPLDYFVNAPWLGGASDL